MIGEQEAEHSRENDGSGPSPRLCYEPSPHHEIPLCLVGGAQSAALAPVVVINHETNGHPHEKADPIHDGEAGHQKEASKNRQNRSNRPSGRAKGSMAIGFAVAENQHASGHQSESKQRSNVREIGEGSDVKETRGNAYDEAGHPGGEIRRLKARMDAAKNTGEKTVARHSEPNTRLADLEDEQGRDHPHERANQNHQPDTGYVEPLECIDHGRGIIDERVPADKSGEHDDD